MRGNLRRTEGQPLLFRKKNLELSTDTEEGNGQRKARWPRLRWGIHHRARSASRGPNPQRGIKKKGRSLRGKKPRFLNFPPSGGKKANFNQGGTTAVTKKRLNLLARGKRIETSSGVCTCFAGGKKARAPHSTMKEEKGPMASQRKSNFLSFAGGHEPCGEFKGKRGELGQREGGGARARLEKKEGKDCFPEEGKKRGEAEPEF